jgi:two-component system, chemotaxis family, chemotaxis protein CheY
VTTILIVDDEIDMRILLRSAIAMASEGLEVVAEAADGVEAIDVWRALDGPPVPDVVILDNRMPRQTGIEAARQILGERPGQIIVLYTSFLDDTLRAEALEIGIRACVAKDEMDTLPNLIRELTSA